jgi:cytochrome P450
MSDAVKIPDHVEPSQVCPFNVYEIPLSEDIHVEMAKVQSSHPDIFYNTTPTLDRMFARGAWTITSYEYAKEVLRDPESFSSAGISGFAELVNLDYDLMIPIDVDPPLHAKVRAIIRDPLMPDKLRELEPSVRALAKDLVSNALQKGRCDFMDDVAAIYPTRIFLLLMGLPDSEADQFLEWEKKLLQPDPNNIQKTIDAIMSIVGRVKKGFDERREDPKNDFLTTLVNAELDGEPLSEELRLGLGFNLFVGGLDTVMNQLSWVFMHLAQHPDLRAELRLDSKRIGPVIDEIMRIHSVLTTRRFVTKDMDFHGVILRKGDAVEMAFATINQDPEAFQCPHEVDTSRKGNRHIGFGFGPHICVGMHLARLEMKVLVEEWLAVIPDFEIENEKDLTFHHGIFGLNNLPLVWAERY